MKNISIRTLAPVRLLRLVLGTAAALGFLFGGLAPIPVANSAPLTPKNSPAQAIRHDAPEIAGAYRALGGGIDGRVDAIVKLGGDVYVGGDFRNVAGISDADFIAKFDGTNWSAVGGGVNGIVQSLVTDGTNLYVGGSFTDAGGIAEADYVAKFDGTSWSALGSGVDSVVNSLYWTDGVLYVGGAFNDAGGNPDADHVASFDGTNWSALGTGLNNFVTSFAGSSTTLYVGGLFTDAGGDTNADQVALFSGGVWSAISTTPPLDPVFALALDGATLYVGTPGSPWKSGIEKFSGGVGSDVGTGLFGTVRTLALDGSDLYAGGEFTNADGDWSADGVAKFSGGDWQALGSGIEGSVLALLPDGENVYIGGRYENAGGNPNADAISKFTLAPSPCVARPSKPVLRSPFSGAAFTKAKVKFDWGDTSCADGYTLQIRRGSKAAPNAYQFTGITASQFHTMPLAEGYEYFWRVQAVNTFGSKHSRWFSFTLH